MTSHPNDEATQHNTMVALARRMLVAKPEHRMQVMKMLDKDTVAQLLTFMLQGLPEDQQKAAILAVKHVQQNWSPKDNDQLWSYIAEVIELRIPRTAVCENHCAPFDFVADAFFERGNADKLIIGNRGSGKTQLSGMLIGLNAKFKAKIEAVSAGAIENQAKKCYDYFKKTVMLFDGFYNKRDVKIRESNFPNGSKVEVVIGTMSGVNSPHPHVAHLDEIELLRPGVFEESANMAQSKTHTIDGKQVTYKAQNWLTSSWKKPRGLVTKLFDEIAEAEREQRRPPYAVYRWCVFETTQRCEHDCDACPFAEIIKDKWTDGSSRSFEQVCKMGSRVPGEGRLKRSDGFIPVDDTLGKFQRLPRRVWEAQQESKRPTAEGLVYEVFDEDIHCIEGWMPDPMYGPVDVGIDFGGKNPFAALFFQTLNVEVDHRGKRLPEGAVIQFDEVYEAGIGNVTFGLLINDKINKWDMEYDGKFSQNITTFYRDPAAKAAAIDLKQLPNHGQGDPRYKSIPTRSLGGVEVDTRIAHVEEQISGGWYYLDSERCENTLNEFLSYEYPEGKNTGQPKKENDHAMDALGYRFWGDHKATGRSGTGTGTGNAYGDAAGSSAPKSARRTHVTPMGRGVRAGRGGVRLPHGVSPTAEENARVVEQAGQIRKVPEEAALPRTSRDPFGPV